MLRYALLGFLYYRPLAGYDLKQIMDDSTANFWHADLSQIYKVLKKLETDGAITSEVEPSESEHPDRRVYTITTAGRKQLVEWLSTPMTDLSPLKEPLILKTFFSALADTPLLIAQLRIQRELHRKRLAEFRAKDQAELERKRGLLGATHRDTLLWEATVRAGILYEAAYVQWLDETLEMLETHANDAGL